MNEVEKMYETIFGEFAPNCSLCAKLVECEIINNTHNCNKYQCDYKRLFTAKNQLGLIKWLCQNTYRNYIHIRYERDINNWKIECNMIGIREFGNFDECFAGLINNLWQDLTDAEKQQVKGILE